MDDMSPSQPPNQPPAECSGLAGRAWLKSVARRELVEMGMTVNLGTRELCGFGFQQCLACEPANLARMNKQIQLTFAAMIFVTICGCVGVKHKSAPRSWPKPIPATNAMEFDGVFSNRSVDPKTGKPGDQSIQLFDFLTGQGHLHGKRGSEVEIRLASDGRVLHVRLLDEQKLEIDSADLQPGADYELSRGFLSLHGPFSGTRARSTNLGTGVEHQSSQLYVSSTSDLLGRQSDSGAGLLFYFVPIVTSTKDCMLWLNISPK